MNEIARKVITVDPDFSAIWGDLDAEAYEGLKAEIKEDGIRDPLVIWNPENNYILIDGHNRLRIAEELHLHAVPVMYKVFKDKAEAAQWIVSHQNSRRNITEWERYKAAETVRKIKSQEAKKHLGGDHGNQHSPSLAKTPNLPKDERINSRKEAAEAVGLSEHKIRQGDYVRDKATDEQKAELDAGKKTLKEVYKETVRANAPKKDDIVRKYEALEESTRQDGKTVDLQKAKVHKQAEDFLSQQKASDAYGIIYGLVRDSRKLTAEMIEAYKGTYCNGEEKKYAVHPQSIRDLIEKLEEVLN